MSEDTGLWFINGLIVSRKIRDTVWRVWQKKRDAYYAEQFAMEARHRREEEAMNKKYVAMMATRPYTPWVGRADKGAVQAFVDQARATLAQRRAR